MMPHHLQLHDLAAAGRLTWAEVADLVTAIEADFADRLAWDRHLQAVEHRAEVNRVTRALAPPVDEPTWDEIHRWCLGDRRRGRAA